MTVLYPGRRSIMRKVSDCALGSLPLRIQASEEWQQTDVWEAVHERLKESIVLNRYIDSLKWEAKDDVLVLTGHLPSFYLKQVLQTALQNLPGVARINNRVEVANSRSLSSVTCVRELLK
jgi:hypothetical protein